ncbi:hypothetical protein ACFWNK_37670 [Streptomyces sp. NPDC058417]|uniref:hypothetical protein n=1 Tax=unclassified Streptomyces TaxID=2593676 RepID=UPI00364B883C
MIRSRTLAATLAVVGALMLSACGGGGDGSDKSTAAAADTGDFRFTSGTARQHNADLSKGDTAADAAPNIAAKAKKPVVRKWVQLTASSVGDLNPVLINGAAFTLYRFDKDTADPSTSNCTGKCATVWPPVLVAPGGRVFLDGVEKSAVGFIERDGAFQVTVGGWPVYLFSKDTKPGDTNGQGVDDVWFGVQPDGQRSGQDADSPEDLPTLPSGPDTIPATSATFFDTANFGEPAQGVGGPGCQEVRFGGSVQISGSAKVWSGKDCTGLSAVITEDLTDLSSLGIGPVNSIRLSN